ncbi:MAG: hypothetical protein OEY89_15945 [Gammaproteobacteria bacterium]|nr:hypothetical protein [Gammaproteobacteria bacterium]
MPYYIYKITPGITDILKNIELQTDFESFKEAKNHVKELRAQMDATDSTSFKIIFANNSLHAEEQLMEKREEPIMREWEK